jgi:arylsulfatase A-like enzyme
MIAHPDFIGSSTKLLGKRSFLKGKRSHQIEEIDQSPFHDVVHELDFRVGQIIAKLEELGLAENTVIVFSSDNGPWSGWPKAKKGVGGEIGSSYPFVGGKTAITEGGTRVPAIISYPKELPAGVVSKELVSGLDWFSTFALLGGAALPQDRTMDGFDLWPFLKKLPEAKSPRDCFFHVKNVKDGALTVSDGDHKLYVGGGDGKLIDLDSDFSERKNVSDANKTIAADLAKKVERINASLKSDSPGAEEFHK